MPALTALAAELGAGFPGDRADIDAEVLAGFLAALTTLDLRKPWIMARLRQAACVAGRAAVRAVLDRDIPALLEEGFGSRPPMPPSRHPDFVLVRAVAEGVLTEAEADLIGVTRLEDTTLGAYARAHGMHPEACAAMRLRAEYRLVAYLLDVVDTPEDDGGITEQVITKLAVQRAAQGGAAPVRRPRTVTTTERMRSQSIRRGLPSSGRKSAVRRCGATPPTGRPALVPSATPEVPRCA